MASLIDGVVLVNESSMTGEPEAVRRRSRQFWYMQVLLLKTVKAIVEVRSTSKNISLRKNR